MRTVARLIAIAFIAMLGVQPAARADVFDPDAATLENGDTEVTARNELGGDGAPIRSSGGTVTCSYVEAGEELNRAGYSGYRGDLAAFDAATDLVEGSWYFVLCTVDGQEGPWRFFQYTPGDLPVDPQFLAYEAVDTLTIAYPNPYLSPPAGLDQLVGFRTWLWIASEGFEPVSATASIPGLSVSATATPTTMAWDMGDGSEPIVCDDAGTAYDTDVADDLQETDCFHVFQWAGDYTATVTTTWAIEWSATNGDGGSLTSIDRTTSVDLHVVERQAVVIDNP